MLLGGLLVALTGDSSAAPRLPADIMRLEMPADGRERTFIGVGDGLMLTVRAGGVAPVTVQLGQTPADNGGRGAVLYGDAHLSPTATVVTSGGAENVARLRVRGDPARPSAFANDLTLTAGVEGRIVAAAPVTVLRLVLDPVATTLLNDMTVPRTLVTIPPTPDLEVGFRFFRRPLKDLTASDRGLTSSSVIVTPEEGDRIRTDGAGIARFRVQAGYGGQGAVTGEARVIYAVGDPGATTAADVYLSNETRCCECCPASLCEVQDCGASPAGSFLALYAGELKIHATDLVIPGRGFDYAFRRTYRSQASHLRPIATGAFGADWALSYSDDRLFLDGKNIVKFSSELRTDVFIATGQPGRFIAPMEYYEQLHLNAEGDIEIRRQDGLVKTYGGFGKDPSGLLRAAGRLMKMEDRNGNVMRFLYTRPSDLHKVVLSTVVDTMGRHIVYRYYPAHDAHPGRRGRLQEVEDFRRDNSAVGRRLRFDYDRDGNLVSVTSPVVLGTPTGNDFPAGKTYHYDYLREADLPTHLEGAERARLLHNLVAIGHPNEAAVELDPANPQALASPPGTRRERLIYGVDSADRAAFDRVLRYTVGGTNGNGIPAGGTLAYAYTFVAFTAASTNSPFLQTRVTDRRGNVTEYVFSAFDTLLAKRELTRGVRRTEPKAFVTRYQYNHDKELVRIRLPEGNVRTVTFDESDADRFQQGNPIRWARLADVTRGGDQTALLTETVYEPIYQQPAAVTDARGLDSGFVPPIPEACARSRRERYTTRYFFDYQEGDPAIIVPMLARELGVSAVEAQARLDASGLTLGLGDLNQDGDAGPRIAGNVVRKVEPSVVLPAGSNQAAVEGDRCQEVVTLYRYNAMGQLTSRVDPEGNVDSYTYFPETDPDGDGRPSGTPADACTVTRARDCRTPDRTTGGYLAEEIEDTASDPIRDGRAEAPPASIRTAYTYDDVGNRTSMTDGRGIRTDHIVNELNQVVRTVSAAAVPPRASGDPPEPLDLVAFAYVENVVYDFNNNVTRREVEDRGNTSNTGGFVEHARCYDILDQVIEERREVDVTETLITRHRYDPNTNRTLQIEPEGTAMALSYDERDLLFQRTRGALAATPETLGAPSGPYNPRGGVPSTMTRHYDRNRNFIEEVDAGDTDGSAANASARGGVGDRTRHLYDGFDRKTSTVDAVGNQTVTQYDPVGNIVRVSRFGPTGGPSPTADGPDPLPTPVSSGGVIQVARLVNATLLDATERHYDELKRIFQTDWVLFVNTIPTQRRPDVADGATDVGKGTLTPNDHRAIPGVAGVAIVGRVTDRTEHDRSSRPAFLVDDDGDTTRVVYDGVDRMIKTIDPEGNAVEQAYDDSDNVIETRETDVAQVPGVPDEVFIRTNSYDSLNRLQRTVDNIGQTYDYRYDSRDNLVAMADAQGPVAGRLITRRAFPSGSRTISAINEFGNVTLQSWDGINRRTRQEWILTGSGQGDGTNIGADLFGVRTTPPAPDPAQGGGDGIITGLADWDGNSLLASLTDDNGNRTSYTYDNLNRKLAETKGSVVPPALADRDDPDTTITRRYDPDDNTVGWTDENGSQASCTFDAVNRRIGCVIERAPGVVGTSATSYAYDGLSRLTRAADNNDPSDPEDDAVITFAYDSLSRVIEETQSIGSGPARAISSAWRAANLRVGLTYADGRRLDQTYDRLDRLKTVADRGAARGIAVYDYIGVHRLLERRYPIIGTRTTYLSDTADADVGYDGQRRPRQRRDLRRDTSLIVGFSHTFDRMGNRLSEVKLHAPGDSELYRYDSAYRLIRADRGTLNESGDGIIAPSPTAIRPSRWTLDGVGNWRRADSETRRHSSFNEIIERLDGGRATTILSDDNGNTANDGTLRFQWDYKNRLRSVTRAADNARVAAYAYDTENRRLRTVMTNSGPLDGTIDFTLDHWREIEERHTAAAAVQQYVYGPYIDEPLVLDHQPGSQPGPGDQRVFYHQNTLYSVFALTNAASTTREGYLYDPYGRPTVYQPGPNGAVDFGGDDLIGADGASGEGNPYLFTGRRLVPSTRLYFYRARYHDPDLGRFLSRDPIGIWDDRANHGNGYAYVGDNPPNRVDPYGLVTGTFVVEEFQRGVTAPSPAAGTRFPHTFDCGCDCCGAAVGTWSLPRLFFQPAIDLSVTAQPILAHETDPVWGLVGAAAPVWIDPDLVMFWARTAPMVATDPAEARRIRELALMRHERLHIRDIQAWHTTWQTSLAAQETCVHRNLYSCWDWCGRLERQTNRQKRNAETLTQALRG